MRSAGELKIAAMAELGGLGDNEGPAVVYRWTPANPLPVLLPWVGVLLLLLLKSNRTPRAWWIWAPLGAVAGVGGLLLPVLASWPSKELGILEELVGAIAFGLAAAWLVLHHLGRSRRFVAFLGFVLVLLGSSSSIMLIRHLENWDGDAWPAGEFALATSLAIAAALALAGLLCRRRYRPVVLCLCVLVLLLPVWLAVTMLWLIIDALRLGFTIDTHQIMVWCQDVVPLVGLSFAVLLPFLILSFANAFYRERLKRLLRLRPEAPPLPEGRSG